MRIRKNAALVTQAERDRYIAAVVQLKQQPAGTANGEQFSEYDRFPALHLGVTRRA